MHCNPILVTLSNVKYEISSVRFLEIGIQTYMPDEIYHLILKKPKS